MNGVGRDAHFDLIIVGAGSGNSVITPDFDHWKIAIVERWLFGGTCLNVGCIPSKMFVYAADVAEMARHGSRLGVHTRFESADWRSIRDRVFGRIDPIASGGEKYRFSLPHVTVFKADARFVGPKALDVGGRTITGDRIVLAAGSRPRLPDLPGLASVPYHTSDSLMRVDDLPDHLVVFGGGYIATEMAHVFGGLGSKVTIINRSESLLRIEDHDVRARFTEVYSRRFDVRLNTAPTSITHNEGVFTIELPGETLRADAVLVAAGRIPNGEQLQVEQTGVELDAAGFVVTDEYLRTGVDGIYALGDITHAAMLKHTANADARVVAHNLAHPDDPIRIDRRFIPHAVFGYPQVASVGATEHELQAQGVPYTRALRDYADSAYGWAMEDTESFCKLLAHRDTRQLLGAHLIGPQASTLIQQLIQGMRFGQTVDDMAHEQYYIHPALPEVVEQALLDL